MKRARKRKSRGAREPPPRVKVCIPEREERNGIQPRGEGERRATARAGNVNAAREQLVKRERERESLLCRMYDGGGDDDDGEA